MVNNTNYNGKVEFTLMLLEQKNTYSIIQNKLKEKYGSGMSNRTLGILRKEVKGLIQPKSLEMYQIAFINIYESILSLKSIIKNPEILQEITEYHNLYYNTSKDLIINNLPEDLRNPKVIKSIEESLEELKNGKYKIFHRQDF